MGMEQKPGSSQRPGQAGSEIPLRQGDALPIAGRIGVMRLVAERFTTQIQTRTPSLESEFAPQVTASKVLEPSQKVVNLADLRPDRLHIAINGDPDLW